MDILKELETTKKKLETLKNERAKVEGMRDQILSQLQAEGINSLEEGQIKLGELKASVAQVKSEAEQLLADFREKYKLFL